MHLGLDSSGVSISYREPGKSNALAFLVTRALGGKPYSAEHTRFHAQLVEFGLRSWDLCATALFQEPFHLSMSTSPIYLRTFWYFCLVESLRETANSIGALTARTR